MNQVKPLLGKLIESPQQRDAIHIAIAPVVAMETLRPGQAISLRDPLDAEGVVIADRGYRPIGIVDPFLSAPVKPGQRFWMFLFPDTITSLRHDWTHPAFAQALSPGDLKKVKEVEEALLGLPEAKRWMEEFAGRCGLSYELVMETGEGFLRGGEIYIQIDRQSARDEFYNHREEFWKNFEIITGLKPTAEDMQESPFSCSC